MTAGRYEIDMSKGSIFKNLIKFSVPLMLTSILQLLYNAADIIVVGRWTGAKAIAAIGATSSLYALLINIFLGLSVGIGVVVSKKYGAQDNEGLKTTSHTAVLMGIIVGFITLFTGVVFCRPLLFLMATPKDVIDLSVIYMRIIFLGMPASMLYNFGAAVLRSVGDTKRPLYILIITGAIKVVLNIFFVSVLKLGVVGVAVATIIVNLLSAVSIMYILMFSDAPYKIKLRDLKLDKVETIEIIKIGLPAGLQSGLFSISNMVIQSAINSLGTAAIAGNSAAYNIECLMYATMTSFYQGTLTSVSQNYGAKQEKRIYKTVYTAIACASVTAVLLGVVSVIFAKPLLGIYITDSPETIAFGVQRMIIVHLPYFLVAVMEQLAGLLRGVGNSLLPAINVFLSTCVLRVLWVFFVFPINPSFYTLYACYMPSWSLSIILHFLCFMLIRKKTMLRMYEQ